MYLRILSSKRYSHFAAYPLPRRPEKLSPCQSAPDDVHSKCRVKREYVVDPLFQVAFTVVFAWDRSRLERPSGLRVGGQLEPNNGPMVA